MKLTFFPLSHPPLFLVEQSCSLLSFSLLSQSLQSAIQFPVSEPPSALTCKISAGCGLQSQLLESCPSLGEPLHLYPSLPFGHFCPGAGLCLSSCSSTHPFRPFFHPVVPTHPSNFLLSSSPPPSPWSLSCCFFFCCSRCFFS